MENILDPKQLELLLNIVMVMAFWGQLASKGFHFSTPPPSFYPRVSCLLHSPGLARVVSRLSFNALKFAFSLALIALLLTGPQLGQYLALLLSLCKVCLPSPLLN